MLALTGGFSWVNYSEYDDPLSGDEVDRSDPRVDAKFFVEYRIRDWIAINATLAYLGNFTDFQFDYSDSSIDEGKYQRFVGLLGVRAMY